MVPSDETKIALYLFHPSTKVNIPLLLIQLDKGYLDWKAFISTLAHSPHLSFGSPLGMVYELL